MIVIIFVVLFILIFFYVVYLIDIDNKKKWQDNKDLEKNEYINPHVKGNSDMVSLYYMDSTQFLDHDGSVIDPAKYEKMVIKGNALEPVNIKNKDLIFIQKMLLKDFYNVELPSPCVFYRAATEDNHAKFTTGVVFAYCKPSDIEDILKHNIFNNSTFDKFRKDPRYVSDYFIYDHLTNLSISNFNGNIALYMKLNDQNQFILEAIPLRTLLGVIKYSFALNNVHFS